MHTCTATSNCKNHASLLLSCSAGWAVCCVVWSPEGPGWPWMDLGGLESQLGRGFLFLSNCQLERREEEEGKRKPPGLQPP